jgi:hypothetical protein
LKNRKYIDLLVLLLISVLVVSASAAVYYVMSMQSTATIAAAPVYFITAGDSSGVLTLGTNGTYARLSLNAYPNVTNIYQQAVNLTATAAKQVQLAPVSITPSSGANVANFTSVVFRLVRSSGAQVANFTYTTSGSGAAATWVIPSATSYVSISNGEKMAIQVELKAAPGAKSGITTTIVLSVNTK